MFPFYVQHGNKRSGSTKAGTFLTA